MNNKTKVNKEPKIKILITYKDRHKVIKSDILTPIQTGRAIADEVFEDMIGDDTGNNISAENLKYNELTAQYWAWKNYDKLGSPDYIGFMHYRRHFLFNQKKKLPDERWLPNSNWYSFNCIDDDYIDFLKDKHIYKAVKDIDCIVPKVYDYNNYCYKNIKKDYKGLPQQNIEHLFIMLNVVKKLYPDYSYVADQVCNGHHKYIANMFIMSKKMFFEYCDFLFAIEEKICEQIDTLHMSKQAIRFAGYLGELLLTIFIYQMKKIGKYKIKECNTSFIKNSSYEEELQPHWAENKQAISVGCSNQYAAYFGVYLESICNFSNKEQKYDIIVLESDISHVNKVKLKEITQKYNNVSLRFYNVNALFSEVNLPISCAYFSKHCYYRLAVGRIFKNFKKVLFTDIDLAVNFDIAEMFSLDMKDNPLAACEEILWTEKNRKGKFLSGKEIDNYVKNDLGCSDKYFNTGVILVDIDKFNKVASFEELLQTGIDGAFFNQEQCVLNKVFNGKITELPSIYNFEIFKDIFNSVETSYRLYMKNLQNAKIYHFLTGEKVWFFPELPKAEIWWNYAKRTPFYEEILVRLIYFKTALNTNEIKLLFVIEHIVRFKFKKYYYAFKKTFVFGSRRQKYQQKYRTIKTLIKEAKKYKKILFKI